MGTQARQELRCRILLPRWQDDALVGGGPVALRGKHLQHHADRPVRRLVFHRHRGVQLQPHRRGGDGILRHLPAAAIHQVKDLHHPGVPGEALRQEVALLFLGHLHHRQHLPGCSRRPLCRGAHHQADVPVRQPGPDHRDLRHPGRFLHHSGRPFVGHQRRAHPGGHPDSGLRDPHLRLLRQRGRRIPGRPARRGRHFRQADKAPERPLDPLARPDHRNAGIGHLLLGQQPDPGAARAQRQERGRRPQGRDVQRLPHPRNLIYYNCSRWTSTPRRTRRPTASTW